MADDQQGSGPPWWQSLWLYLRPHLGRVGIALVAALGIPVVIGLVAQGKEPAEWHWDDWAAIGTSLWLGLFFFALAIYVNRDADRRAEAVANAELITSMGSLAMSSARSFAGHDQQALRIAADARAALQHYPNAGGPEQHGLIRTIEDSYSDLAFGTFARADGLPRSVWDGLCAGAEELGKEAARLAGRVGKKALSQQDELKGLAAHVRFVQRVGDAVRLPAAARSTHAPDGFRALDGIWRDRDESGSEVVMDSRQRIERLRCLYNRELTVLKKWDVLLDSAETITCSAVLIEDLTLVDEWRAPWYVVPTRETGSCCMTADVTLRPVNVLCEDLTEPAMADQVFDRGSFPTYPEPLRHGHLPEGLRTEAIDNLCKLLDEQAPITVCVLRYDAKAPDGTTVRLVLDGNHRLAAARRIFRQWCRSTAGPRHAPVRVLAFVISEMEKVDTRVNDAEVLPQQQKFLPWRGFTPDLALLHGDEYPERRLTPPHE